ncbi:hypothetical protein AB3S75_019980 [Citrus x aurantiifolia]
MDQAENQKQQKWMPPPRNVLKVDVDAAVSTKDGLAGLGAVMKDSFGKVVAAGVKQVQLKKDASFAEAEAVELGLRVAKDAAAQSLIIEIDCLDVAELANNTKGSRTKIFWIIS